METVQSKIEQFFLPEIEGKKVSLFVKREDLVHPIISGNKYRKLFYNIQKAKNEGFQQLLTFGGAYSNHILATAAAGYEFGFKTVGIIRGEELGIDLDKTLATNPTLKAADSLGMKLYFVSRADYRLKHTKEFLGKILDKFFGCYLLPEGGTNELAIKGCEGILGKDTEQFDVICTAVGTGGTISGIINSSLVSQQVLGFPVLKGDFLKEEIKGNGVKKHNWKLITDYHFGGYAKINKELIDFNNYFHKVTNILLDPVYTGKMFFGVIDMIKNDRFDEGTKILLIHTGGIQGIKGMNTILTKKSLPLLTDRTYE
ncbi:pyridoxal-phosphate dependent enzyme [Flavicella sp.]|uniref:1-aminocyclopropane-1-carboxylate deaminase/D-cysteine desulfhydrase n=1 Tax=Flavicella sp. TaxID=2957742 RepID=UPI003017D83F